MPIRNNMVALTLDALSRAGAFQPLYVAADVGLDAQYEIDDPPWMPALFQGKMRLAIR